MLIVCPRRNLAPLLPSVDAFGHAGAGAALGVGDTWLSAK
jgi:hypothetical protein